VGSSHGPPEERGCHAARKMDAGADDKPGYFLHGLISCYMHVLETVIVIVIDTAFSRTFYIVNINIISQSNNDNGQQGPPNCKYA
jgi:hypothetical protein